MFFYLSNRQNIFFSILNEDVHNIFVILKRKNLFLRIVEVKM